MEADDQPRRHCKTSRYLSRYEEAKLLGTRAQHIANGAPVTVQLAETQWDPLAIASMELDCNKSPTIVRRLLPDGSYEDSPSSELQHHYRQSPNVRTKELN